MAGVKRWRAIEKRQRCEKAGWHERLLGVAAASRGRRRGGLRGISAQREASINEGRSGGTGGYQIRHKRESVEKLSISFRNSLKATINMISEEKRKYIIFYSNNENESYSGNISANVSWRQLAKHQLNGEIKARNEEMSAANLAQSAAKSLG
jgi:hypothetical protein